MDNNFEDLILKQADSLRKVQVEAFNQGYKAGKLEAKNIRKPFEEFLQDQFFKSNNPTKDDFEKSFEAWLERLDTQEVMDFAQEWGA